MNGVIREWYEDKAHIDEMKHWRVVKLKDWELRVTPSFPRGARVLDVGCGMGREAFALTDMGFSVVGIDISSQVIRQVTTLSAENRYDIRFMEYDGHILPFDNVSFDVIVIWAQTFGLLWGDTYKREFLAECRRVLAPDGLLSYSAHDFEYLSINYSRFLKGRKFYPYADTELYWEAMLQEELTAYAEQAGFRVLFCGKGEIYKPEDGTIIHCLCKKTQNNI